jgi:hypothetical protein
MSLVIVLAFIFFIHPNYKDKHFNYSSLEAVRMTENWELDG